ncbi:WhiB family transcription factor [Mycobacterium phage Piper2020]|nr:WhiB family transcription factor [Mycobacterium phage Piper2020]
MTRARDAEEWRQSAVCAQTDPELFFPATGESATPARTMCKRCEVQAECLQRALDDDEQFGIWGGLTPQQRRALKRGREFRTCGHCGDSFVPVRSDHRFCSKRCAGLAQAERDAELAS